MQILLRTRRGHKYKKKRGNELKREEEQWGCWREERKGMMYLYCNLKNTIKKIKREHWIPCFPGAEVTGGHECPAELLGTKLCAP